MSSLYSRPRPRTPPSPPPLSQRSSNSRNSRNTTKGFDEPSKSFSSKDYGKYSSYSKYDKCERTKYDKNEKYNSVLDYKLDKPNYKSSSYLPSKEYRRDYSPPSLLKESSNHGEKYRGGKDSYSDEPYKSRRNPYSESSYTDRDLYVSKYSAQGNDKYSKYLSPDRKVISDSKYPSHNNRGSLTNSGGDKKYSYADSKNVPYPKYASERDSFYDKKEGSYDCYDSYRQGSSQDRSGGGKRREGESRLDYSDNNPLRRGSSKNQTDINDSFESSAGGYQRYVIGDSVVYGSPGHYPKDIYPPSPKLKRPRSPHSPPPLLSSSKMGNAKKYSRYSSSPQRYSSSRKGENSRRDQTYSRSNNSYRRPLSPEHSYEGLSSHNRNDHPPRSYPPLMKNKGFDDDKDRRFFNQRDNSLSNQNMRPHNSNLSGDYNSYRGKDEPYTKPSYSSYQGNPKRGNTNNQQSKELVDRPPPRHLAPRPLLSIPINLGSLPINGLDKLGRPRRVDGRIMGGGKRALSPKDKRKRRPDDLRLWIESRKTNIGPLMGNKGKGQVKRPIRGNEGGNRSRLMDSRRRILNKGKRKGGGAPLRGMKKAKRMLPQNPKPNNSNNKVKDSKKDDSRNSSTGGNRSRHNETNKGDKDRSSKGNYNRERKGGEASNKTSGRSAASAKKPLKRPKNISHSNRLALKQRPAKRAPPPRSPQDREKSSYSNDKNNQNKSKSRETNSRTYSRPRGRSFTRSRSRSKSRQRSRSRSPRRNDKGESSSYSRH